VKYRGSLNFLTERTKIPWFNFILFFCSSACLLPSPAQPCLHFQNKLQRTRGKAVGEGNGKKDDFFIVYEAEEVACSVF
jgi:hypothetical protein